MKHLSKPTLDANPMVDVKILEEVQRQNADLARVGSYDAQASYKLAPTHEQMTQQGMQACSRPQGAGRES
ncbi:MAG: hypothetical protein ACE37K_11125 [Planctomycetota bacterium]